MRKGLDRERRNFLATVTDKNTKTARSFDHAVLFSKINALTAKV
jgi:hypothetical protein